MIERNQSQWPDSRVLLAFALHLAGQPLYGNSMAPSGSSSSCPFVVSFFFGYLLLVIVPRLFPFRHAARRNVARAIQPRPQGFSFKNHFLREKPWARGCGRLTEVRKSAGGMLRYARGILVYGVAGLETFFFSKLDHCL